jgi:hypothetical protein
MSIDRVLRVKALWEEVSEDKLRVDIFIPWRFEVNHNHLIQEDMRQKSMHFEEK